MDYDSLVLIFLLSILTRFVTYTVGNEAIISGAKATVNQFPYQVSVQTDNGDAICGGGVIDELFILTSAHCFLNENRYFKRYEYISVLAGSIDRHKKDHPAMFVKVKKIYVPENYVIHPEYRPHDDIAVLRLEHPLHLSNHIQKLHLPNHKFEKYEDKTAVITGYGWDWIRLNDTYVDGGHENSHLRFAEARVLRSNQCGRVYGLNEMTETFLCAKIEHHSASDNRSTCYGDSGGPLVHNNIVIGILSVAPKGCTEKIKSSIYIAVSHFLKFIADAKEDKKTNEILGFNVKH